MKELEINAVNNLIDVYETYLRSGLSAELTQKAKKAYDEYLPAYALLDKNINKAIGNLFTLAYPNADPNRILPTKEEVNEIVKILKKRNKN